MNTEEVKVSGDAPLNITLKAEAHQIEASCGNRFGYQAFREGVEL